jgi:hypothetical protein
MVVTMNRDATPEQVEAVKRQAVGRQSYLTYALMVPMVCISGPCCADMCKRIRALSGVDKVRVLEVELPSYANVDAEG